MSAARPAGVEKPMSTAPPAPALTVAMLKPVT